MCLSAAGNYSLLDPALLIRGYQSIMRTIYSPREYYQRALDSMRRTDQEFTEPQHYNLISAVTSFTRIMLKLGVLDMTIKYVSVRAYRRISGLFKTRDSQLLLLLVKSRRDFHAVWLR